VRQLLWRAKQKTVRHPSLRNAPQALQGGCTIPKIGEGTRLVFVWQNGFAFEFCLLLGCLVAVVSFNVFEDCQWLNVDGKAKVQLDCQNSTDLPRACLKTRFWRIFEHNFSSG